MYISRAVLFWSRRPNVIIVCGKQCLLVFLNSEDILCFGVCLTDYAVFRINEKTWLMPCKAFLEIIKISPVSTAEEIQSMDGACALGLGMSSSHLTFVSSGLSASCYCISSDIRSTPALSIGLLALMRWLHHLWPALLSGSICILFLFSEWLSLYNSIRQWLGLHLRAYMRDVTFYFHHRRKTLLDALGGYP